MLIWSAVLFGLGLMAFLDSVFNMGQIFRQINSVMFMLTALALLIRTTTKKRDQELEKKQRRLLELEHEVYVLKENEKKMVGL